MSVPHGTTILALRYQNGVLIAGDRRAIEGPQISSRTMEKVYKTDDYSAMAIAGAAGPAIDMARLFQVELEHYEKLEGERLTLEGKANRLAQMIRQNLPAAFQGLIVIPIFAGYDLKRKEGRIFKYDVVGGKYEEEEFYATGSGGKDARNTMKKLYRRGLQEEEALKVALEALIDASEEDVGTGGPDLVRGIYPTVKKITEQGIMDVPETTVASICKAIIESRKNQ
ncbi:MAG TPA: proteasome subunit beta [Candidatus Limnocylindrales bacterium]|nr:proteasome subunit beta [Candidatus Limnocylindrales bacterium]